MMELVYIYILIGLIGGITAGMLGLGGGIIFVPGLLLVTSCLLYTSDAADE